MLAQGFQSLDEMQSRIPGVSFEVVPLRTGEFKGRSRSAVAPGFVFTICEMDAGHRYRGLTPSDELLFGLAIETGDGTYYGSSEASAGDLSLTQPGTEFTGRVSGVHAFALISISRTILEGLGGLLAASDHLWFGNHHVQPPPRVREAARRATLALKPVLADPSHLAGELRTRLAKRAMLFPFLLAAAFDKSHASYDTTQSHEKIVRRSELWIEDQPPETLHVIDLCLALGLPLRTVQRAFHQSLGIGPAHYLKFYQLSRVHEALLSRDPADTRIADIAVDHGFWELGRFAGSYRAVYGERPSDTLKRPRKQEALIL